MSKNGAVSAEYIHISSDSDGRMWIVITEYIKESDHSLFSLMEKDRKSEVMNIKTESDNLSQIEAYLCNLLTRP